MCLDTTESSVLRAGVTGGEVSFSVIHTHCQAGELRRQLAQEAHSTTCRGKPRDVDSNHILGKHRKAQRMKRTHGPLRPRTENDKQNILFLCPFLFCSLRNLPEQRQSSLLGLRPSVAVQPVRTFPKYGTEHSGLHSRCGSRSLCLFLHCLSQLRWWKLSVSLFPVLIQLITGIGELDVH